MPTEIAVGGVVAAVEAVARQGRQVDSAHERHLVVDDHELLVMAVHRALAGVELAADPRPGDEVLARPPHFRPVWLEHRQWRARPDQHAHVGLLRHLGEQIAQARLAVAAHEREVGRDVPAGDMDVRARALDRLGDGGQRALTVDQHVELVAGARRRIALDPERRAGRRLEHVRVPEAVEPSPVVLPDRLLETVAHGAVKRSTASCAPMRPFCPLRRISGLERRSRGPWPAWFPPPMRPR